MDVHLKFSYDLLPVKADRKLKLYTGIRLYLYKVSF